MNLLNNKGISIVESLIAVMLTALMMIGLLTMQPLSMQSAGKADAVSHATELMQSELETAECNIMDKTLTLPGDKVNVVQTIGNQTYTINRTTTLRADGITYLVRVRVNWPGNTNGVSSSLIVSRLDAYTS